MFCKCHQRKYQQSRKMKSSQQIQTIIHKFKEVFPNELPPRIPSKGVVEHKIVLEANSNPFITRTKEKKHVGTWNEKMNKKPLRLV